MKKLPSSDKVYVMESKIPNSGRGVYARHDIEKGEIIETCPVIEISESETANLNEGILITYLFYYGPNKNQSLIALGLGSMYNHSYSPNAMYKIESKEKVMDFIALRGIKKGEEITFNYKQGNSKNSSPLWFE